MKYIDEKLNHGVKTDVIQKVGNNDVVLGDGMVCDFAWTENSLL